MEQFDMTNLRRSLTILTLLLSSLTFYANRANGNERVLVVGDSITGHSMNLPYGYAHEIRNLISEHKAGVEFVPLGGSGQTIFSWRNIVKNSKEQNFRLDIEGIMIKEEFDKGADVMIVHLGMNDALQPSIKYNEDGLKSWKEEYAKLVADLRDRVPSVKRIILTPPTLLTESPYTFKNVFMDQLSGLVEEVAKENDCEFFDLRKEFTRAFLSARNAEPDFRITLDFVHPNEFGHQIMAWSFLKALGNEELETAYLEKKVAPKLLDHTTPGFAAFVNDVPLSDKNNVSYGENDAVFAPVEIKVKAQKIDELSVTCDIAKQLKVEKTAPDEFTVSFVANISDLPTKALLKSNEIEREVLVNAPYFVTTGVAMDPYRYPNLSDFPKDKTETIIDALVKECKDPLKESLKETSSTELATTSWSAYYPTADKTGAANPNSLDVASLAPANAFDAAYAVRYVFSDDDRDATLNLNSEGFSTTSYLKAYLNGTEVYFDCLSPRSPKWKDNVEIHLQKGLNVIVVRLDHTHWQWADSISVE